MQRTVMGRTRNGKVLAVLQLKMRGIAGYSTACVRLRKAVESLGMIELNSGRPAYETGILAATCSLLLFGGDEKSAMVPVSSI